MSHYLATTFCGRSLFLFLTQTLILPSLTHTWSLLSAFYLGHLRTPCFTRPTRLAKSSSMANFTKASLKRNPKWKTLETELESGKLTLASSIARWWTWDRNNWNSRQLCTCVHILLDQSDTSFHMASRCLVLLCDVLCLPVVSIRASIVICFIRGCRLVSVALLQLGDLLHQEDLRAVPNKCLGGVRWANHGNISLNQNKRQ